MRYDAHVHALRFHRWLAVCAVLAGCAGAATPSARFSPAAPQFAGGLPAVTYPAVRAYARDVKVLRASGGFVLGELSGENGNVAEDAARRGATHFVWVGSDSDRRAVPSLCWQRPALPAAPMATSCRPSVEQVTSEHYVLVRVEPGAWPGLPAELRPSALLGGEGAR